MMHVFKSVNPWTHQIIGETKELSEFNLTKIIEKSKKVLADTKFLSDSQIKDICPKTVANLIKNKESLLKIVIEETGLVKQDALHEIERAIQNFEITSDMYPTFHTNKKIHISRKEFAIINNIPAGIVLAITPSTSPLSSPAHIGHQKQFVII
ncbi:MAG: aldehyde dehydrogenase family protein [Bacteroidales bacterium]